MHQYRDEIIDAIDDIGKLFGVSAKHCSRVIEAGEKCPFRDDDVCDHCEE